MLEHGRGQGAPGGTNQRIYQLEATPFEELDDWVETFRKLWEGRLDNLNDLLQEMKQAETHKNKPTNPGKRPNAPTQTTRMERCAKIRPFI